MTTDRNLNLSKLTLKSKKSALIRPCSFRIRLFLEQAERDGDQHWWKHSVMVIT